MNARPLRYGRAGLWLLPALVGLAASASAQDAKTWLVRMNQAVEQLSYEGTFVHVVDGAAETLRIVHQFAGGEVAERIHSLDGPAREIIRNGQRVQCVLPDHKLVLLESPLGPSSPLSSTLPNYSEGLEAHYEFISFERDQVAQRDTQVVVIKGRDDFRHGYVLWLDRETAIPLRFQVRDEVGKIIDEILFTEFELRDSIPDEALAATIDSRDFRRVGPAVFAPREEAQATWQATVLPEGFELTLARRSGSDDGTLLEHLVYSDGLANISVFVDSADADVVEGHSRFGSTNAYTLSLGSFKVTAMGDVPPETIRRVAASVGTVQPKRR